ncbi:nucleotide exchange factor GrpE [Boudabousia liubingyangii]|uniref:Protein GrpE n=1 Tax=Boudabousia liubingyangii TaxID=1921764 RepID=A0A1Q5PLL7_9ACTO|nr:nucleotide exchange factor GrpE [Boudabousia liubingyangii]OKL47948.1 nucleotide exchange factor GrpE [Boudabousia liubingyangii]
MSDQNQTPEPNQENGDNLAEAALNEAEEALKAAAEAIESERENLDANSEENGVEAADTEAETEADPLAQAQARVKELEEELARANAEYYNLNQQYNGYVRRAKADIPGHKDAGRADILTALVPVFDDIYAAQNHEELTGPFAAIVKKLTDTLGSAAQFTMFGEAGEAFDPQVHEALMAEEKAEVTEPVVAQVLQPGFKMGEKVLRPARVIVHNPA